MSAIKKFDFNNSFDATERGMVAARDFTMDDIEAARNEGFELGREAGLRESKESIEHALGIAIEGVRRDLGSMTQALERLRHDLERRSIETVLAICRKLAPSLAAHFGLSDIENTIRQCMSAVYDEPRIVIRAHEDTISYLEARLEDLKAQSGFNGRVVLYSDDAITRTDCRVEWADGGAERNLEKLFEEIEKSVSTVLTQSESQATASASEVDGVQGIE